MKVLVLRTDLFPDGETVGAALDSLAESASVTTADLTALAPEDDARWTQVAESILTADLVVTV